MPDPAVPAPTGGDARPVAEGLKPEAYFRTGAGIHGWQRRLMGMLLGWRWFDTATLFMLRRVFFPTTRMWAAAHVASGQPNAFCQAVPMSARFEDAPKLAAKLARFDEACVRAKAMDAAWEAAFFGKADVPMNQRIPIESARLDARQALNGCRRLFVPYIMRAIPRVRLATRTPAETEALYGDVVTGLAQFASQPLPMPTIEVSRPIPGTVGRDYWLRFQSPSARLNDVVTARVHEPIGIANPPTIILGHGVCIEFDHWRGLVDETDELVALGFRVIRPEAPWHGRRTQTGRFGGEAIIAEFPTGALDVFTGAVQEWAVLADWAKRTSTGPLAMGGTSLGAQMAQLAAHKSAGWPQRLRPQALLLITHCGSIAEAVLHGALPEIFGSADDVAAKGWSPQLIQPYLGLLDPARSAPIDPGCIVSVIGRYDRVTPFASGDALLDDWKVPAANRFIFDRGHFSVPMTLIRNPAPLQRFAAVVGQIPG